MTPDVLSSLTEYQYLRERLQAEFPGADEDTLRDTLEGISSFPETLAAVVRSYLDDLDLAAALGIRITDMQERLSRFEQRADKKRELVTSVMERANIKKLAEPDFTVSLRAVPPSVVVVDEAQIPQDYWKPQPPRLDRQGISAALKGGSAIPGAALSNPEMTISVRTK
jgi:Siphovirus Gp157